MSTIALFKKEFTEQWRTSKILILVLPFFVVGVSGPISIKYLPEILKSSNNLNNIQIIIPKQTAIDAIASYFNSMGLMPILILILVAMGTVAGEKERGTNVFTLTKPVTRSQFILVKYFAWLVTLTGALLIAIISAGYYTFLLFEGFEAGNFLALNIPVIIFMGVILALIVFCSSIFNTSVAAGGASFLAFLILNLSSTLIPGMKKVSPYISFDPEILRAIMTGKTPAIELILPSIVGFALIAIILFSACFIYERREM